ncbi:hypothetical protein [Bacillus haynesii]|uniref:hypothetical protein n=1 Tax=Bacillus haynesii TaxID=1925021 RepID=UPI002280B91A|nr:hypothetical protein [Bacillus haynesii]MCY9434169.1 hypothetical protein [Bacillus haynesii]MEC0754605.1 hypothetical protein [Bacillus haynesii]
MSDSKRLKEMKNVWNCTKVHFNPDTFGWIDYLIEYAENLEVENERLRAENAEYKGKYERFYSRFCEANSKLYDSNTDNERLKRENEQLRQAIADARHLASYHGTTEDIYNRLIEVDPTHQTLKYLREIEKGD